MNGPHDGVGIVGLGLLGSAIADRLRAAGHAPLGHDLDPGRLEAFVRSGGSAAESGAEVLSRARVVVLCLPTSSSVLELFETAADVDSVDLVLDATTGSPDDVERMVSWVGARGGAYVEAKVAGSSEQMRDGEAVVLVGVSDEAVAAAEPVLAAMSNRRFRIGAAGAAARFKLVHNLVLGLHRAVLAEALTFADALGLDPAETLATLEATPAASAVMRTKGPAMVAREYPARATLSQHLKDVRLVLENALAHNAAVPLSTIHARLLETAVAAGFGDADNAAVVEAFTRWTESTSTAG